MLASTVDAGLLRTAAERKNDERILVQIRDKDCVALEVRYHKVCYSNYTIFLAREAKTTTTCVPMYERSYNVFCKEVVETEIIKGKAIMYMMHLLEKFVVIAKETENVDASKYRSSKLKQRLINSYPQLVFYLPKSRNVSEIVYAENLDTTDLVEEHMFNKAENTDEEFDEGDYIGEGEVHDNNSYTETPANSQLNELQVLYNAALILKKKVHEIPKLDLPWPPLASDLTMTNVKKMVPCELFNTLAWICGFSSEPTLNNYVEIDHKESAKLMSITQDLVNLASNQRNPTPKSIALAMALRQLTGSASVISLLSGLGHCMSYSFVLSHETALAQLNISKDSTVPPGFIGNVPTTLAWDNDDFSEETRSGKGTTHITGGIIIQRDAAVSYELERRESISRRKSVLAPSKDFEPYFLGKRKTVNLNDAMQNYEIGEEHHVEPQNDAKKKDLAFTLCRHLGKGITLPNWTGFNTKLIYKRDIPTQSKIGYLPIIDASPTELSTVKEILNQSEKIADKLNLKYMCLVFDEAIYSKVQQIRWKEEGYLSRFIVRLGDFHMAMSYCGAISKLFKDAGLKVFLTCIIFIVNPLSCRASSLRSKIVWR